MHFSRSGQRFYLGKIIIFLHLGYKASLEMDDKNQSNQIQISL